jgi:uncharacterized membrane protein YdjX (TVP38/TMEM64 family)
MGGMLRLRFRRPGAWLKAGAVVLLLIMLVLAARALPVREGLAWLVGWVEQLGPWGPVLFLAALVLATLVSFPVTPISIAAGAVFGSWGGVALLSLGTTVSAALSFLASRTVAHAVVAERIRHYPRLHAVYRALGARGSWKLVAAVRLSQGIPFGLQNLVFGLTPVRFGPYLLATGIAMLPGIVLYVTLGHLGAAALESSGEVPAGPLRWLVRLVGVAAAGIALLYVAHTARKAIKEQTGLDLNEPQELAEMQEPAQ